MEAQKMKQKIRAIACSIACLTILSGCADGVLETETSAASLEEQDGGDEIAKEIMAASFPSDASATVKKELTTFHSEPENLKSVNYVQLVKNGDFEGPALPEGHVAIWIDSKGLVFSHTTRGGVVDDLFSEQMAGWKKLAWVVSSPMQGPSVEEGHSLYSPYKDSIPIEIVRDWRDIEKPNHFVELFSDRQVVLAQEFDTIPGTELIWSIKHSGRWSNNTASVGFRSAKDASGASSTLITSQAGQWTSYSGKYKVPEGQTKTRLVLANAGGPGEHNWIDDISVVVDPKTLPSPKNEVFVLPAAVLPTVPLIADKECEDANNGFFKIGEPDPEVEARRRYIAEQFLVPNFQTGKYDPIATFNQIMQEHKTKKKGFSESSAHVFGVVALMYNQAVLSNDSATRKTWIDKADEISVIAVKDWLRSRSRGDDYLPFNRYQLMDTYVRWHCLMADKTKSTIRDYMTSQQFDGRYGTANLKILNAHARYLAGQAWPNATDWKGGKIIDISKSDPNGEKLLKKEALDLYKFTSDEWASQPYDGYNTFVHMSLAQLSKDRELAEAAHYGFQAAVAKTASVWVNGILATYSLRDYPPFKSGASGAFASHWYWLGGKIPERSFGRSYLVGAAVNYHLPKTILNIVRDANIERDTRITLSSGGSRVHSQSYLKNAFGVFSNRSATRDGAAKTFVPGQTTPPGVVWNPTQGRSNFWLTLTDDANLLSADKQWTNTSTGEVHAKYGQQWLQHKGTLLMVTDNVEHKIPKEETALHQIIGSMPKPNDTSMVDAACAKVSCKTTKDGRKIYHLFFSRDDRVLIAVASAKPFNLQSQRTKTDWQNGHGFTIPLEYEESLANAVAIEADDYLSAKGENRSEKLSNWKTQVLEKSDFIFELPQSDYRRASIKYKDSKGNTLFKEYIWSGNAPYYRLKGWDYNKNPDPDKRPLEIVNDTAIDHTTWPAIDNQYLYQPTEARTACPLYLRSADGKTWVKLWDDNRPLFAYKSGCKKPSNLTLGS
jgi:hypothetical protein